MFGHIWLKFITISLLFTCYFSGNILFGQCYGSIEGKIVNQDLQALKDAVVSIPRTNTLSYSDEKGSFLIPNLQASIYLLRVECKGYRPLADTVTIIPGLTIMHVFKVVKEKKLPVEFDSQ